MDITIKNPLTIKIVKGFFIVISNCKNCIVKTIPVFGKSIKIGNRLVSILGKTAYLKFNKPYIENIIKKTLKIYESIILKFSSFIYSI
ncbi:hypothetical protein SAMN02194393_01997 [Maledivibacter halophilus]|uniref:Uncharacterized protein n=1 Tax=Maledivibacter halophilus TaxID=36842 RepID=A0A1T5KPE3_9FIRM|nr:hypothetical protein SAMN02194393_01997 [Maledivibacter halophilus]